MFPALENHRRTRAAFHSLLLCQNQLIVTADIDSLLEYEEQPTSSPPVTARSLSLDTSTHTEVKEHRIVVDATIARRFKGRTWGKPMDSSEADEIDTVETLLQPIDKPTTETVGGTGEVAETGDEITYINSFI